jgi:hypothetical protein
MGFTTNEWMSNESVWVGLLAFGEIVLEDTAKGFRGLYRDERRFWESLPNARFEAMDEDGK